MKSLLPILFAILLLLLPIFAKSQDKYFAADKALHVVCSAVLTSAFTDVAVELKFKKPRLIGCSMALSVGVAKEFLYDKNVSTKDLMADAVGVITGYYLNKLIQRKWGK